MDPFGSLGNMMGQAQSFFSNPMQFMLGRRMNLPQNIGNDPNQIIQYLMNSGKLSQEQYNQAAKASKGLQQNPQVMQMLGRFRH